MILRIGIVALFVCVAAGAPLRAPAAEPVPCIVRIGKPCPKTASTIPASPIAARACNAAGGTWLDLKIEQGAVDAYVITSLRPAPVLGTFAVKGCVYPPPVLTPEDFKR